MARSGDSARGHALFTLTVGAMLSGIVGWLHDVPVRWTHAETTVALEAAGGPLAPLGATLLALLPWGPHALRFEAAALASIVLLATLTGWVAGRLLPIAGRHGVHVVAPVFVAIAVLPRFQLEPAGSLTSEIWACFPGLLALAWRAHHREATVRDDLWVGFVASLGWVWHLHTGLAMLALVAAAAWELPRSDTHRAHGYGFGLGMLPSGVAFALWMSHGDPAPWTPPSFALSGNLSTLAMPPGLVALGVGALALLGLALHHHSAAVLLLALVLGQWMTLGGRSLAPPIVVALALGFAAAATLAWIAGARRFRAIALTAAASFMLAVMVGQWRPHFVPIADIRPVHTLLRVYDRGLVAPGDAVLAFGGWQHFARHAAKQEGWRPDVLVLDATALKSAELVDLTLRWDTTGRRVLSDSFDAAGHWEPTWMVDSGPLFWFVGHGAITEPEFTDLSRLEAPLAEVDAVARREWVNLQIERARFRRALGEADAALYALPLTAARRRGLRTRLQLAQSTRPTPATASELGAGYDPNSSAPARLAAECADLLYAHGEQTRGTELFVESADQGASEALSALARWQFRAGQEAQAQTTLGWLASEAKARPQAIELGHWLLDRNRKADARTLLQRIRNTTPEHAAEEIGLRLRLLDPS